MGGNSDQKLETIRAVKSLVPAVESLMLDISKYKGANSDSSKFFVDNMRAYMEYPNLAVANLMIKNIFESYKSYLGEKWDFDLYTSATMRFAKDNGNFKKISETRDNVLLFLSKMDYFMSRFPDKIYNDNRKI